MRRKFILLMIIAALVIFFPSAVFGQSSTGLEQRIGQSILIKGRLEQGVLIVKDGKIQTPSCNSPEQYVTADQSESGWACFDQPSQTWLTHALPPQAAAGVYEQSPAVIYSEPSTVYDYGYGYPYPYYAYPYYAYPYPWAPFGLGFGFGFGNGGHHFHDGHAFRDGHAFHNGQAFAHRGGGFAPHNGGGIVAPHSGGGMAHSGGGMAHGGGGMAHGGGGFGGHMGGGMGGGRR